MSDLKDVQRAAQVAAFWYSWKFSNLPCSGEDLISEGVLGAFAALPSYDSLRSSVKKHTFLYVAACRQIQRYLDKNVGRCPPRVASYANVEESLYTSETPEEVTSLLPDKLLGNVDKDTRTVIRMRIDGHSWRAIGDRFQLSREWARKTYKAGIAELREIVEC